MNERTTIQKALHPRDEYQERGSQKILAKEGKSKSYCRKIQKYQQNRMSQNNENWFYEQVNGKKQEKKLQPKWNSERFWEYPFTDITPISTLTWIGSTC